MHHHFSDLISTETQFRKNYFYSDGVTTSEKFVLSLPTCLKTAKLLLFKEKLCSKLSQLVQQLSCWNYLRSWIKEHDLWGKSNLWQPSFKIVNKMIVLIFSQRTSTWDILLNEKFHWDDSNAAHLLWQWAIMRWKITTCVSLPFSVLCRGSTLLRGKMWHAESS